MNIGFLRRSPAGNIVNNMTFESIVHYGVLDDELTNINLAKNFYHCKISRDVVVASNAIKDKALYIENVAEYLFYGRWTRRQDDAQKAEIVTLMPKWFSDRTVVPYNSLTGVEKEVGERILMFEELKVVFAQLLDNKDRFRTEATKDWDKTPEFRKRERWPTPDAYSSEIIATAEFALGGNELMEFIKQHAKCKMNMERVNYSNMVPPEFMWK